MPRLLSLFALFAIGQLFLPRQASAQDDVYFKDTFSDDHNEWSFPDEHCFIGNGKYVMAKSDEGCQASWISVDMPRSDDYAIELTTTHESGAEDYEIGRA